MRVLQNLPIKEPLSGTNWINGFIQYADPIRDPVPWTDIVFDVNLQFGTNFSTLVVDQESWEAGIISVLPLRNEIIRDGIR